MKWYEIFKSGLQTDNNGEERNWTTSDLDAMVTMYNEQPNAEKHTAPIILGHVESNTPAFGWVDKLKRVGNTLLATFRDVEPQFAELVNAGRYKTVSAAFYDDLKLRHLAFLGANVPAVKGLEAIQFTQSDIKFSEYNNCFVFQQKESTSMDEFQKSLLEFAKITFGADVVSQLEEYITTYNESKAKKEEAPPEEGAPAETVAPKAEFSESAELAKLRKQVFELQSKQKEYEFSEFMNKNNVPDAMRKPIRVLLGNNLEFSESNQSALLELVKNLQNPEITHEFAEKGKAPKGDYLTEIEAQIKYVEGR